MTVGSVSTHHGGSFSIKGLGAGYGFGRNESIVQGIHIQDVEECSNEMVFSGYEMENSYKKAEQEISKKMKNKHKKKRVAEPTQQCCQGPDGKNCEIF